MPLAVISALAVMGLQIVKWKLNSSTSDLAAHSEPQELKEGAILPDLDLRTLDGKSHRLSQLGSKVTLMNFWATWCEACMVEMPSLIKLFDTYKDRGLDVVAVNLDDKPEEMAPSAARRLKMRFPIYVDPDATLTNLFDVQAIPLTIIINQERKVLHIEGGERDWMDTEMKTLMNHWLGS